MVLEPDLDLGRSQPDQRSQMFPFRSGQVPLLPEPPFQFIGLSFRKQNPPFPLLLSNPVGQPFGWVLFGIVQHVDLIVAAFLDVHIVRMFSVAIRIQLLPFAVRRARCPRTLTVDAGAASSGASTQAVVRLLRVHRRAGTIRTDLLSQSLLVCVLCVGSCKEKKNSLVFYVGQYSTPQGTGQKVQCKTTGIPRSGTPVVVVVNEASVR